MSTNAKTRLTWSLAILLALATIATSVSYVVSAHTAQAQDGSHHLRQIALITGPGIPPRGLWAFDISFVDDQSQVYYLADASNASVDLIDTRTNTLIGQIGGFRGFHGSRETQGPGGVLVDDLGQLWASDGDSTVKLIDLSSRTIVATLRTGGAKRTDEMAYDPQDQLLLVTNGSEAVPFATFISVTRRAIGYREAMALCIPMACTTLAANRPGMPTKLTSEALQELLSVAGECEALCPLIQPRSGSDCPRPPTRYPRRPLVDLAGGNP